MCSICKDILVDFGVEHTESHCPIRNSRYCSYCAQYGHLTKSCPAAPPLWAREPTFMEQLIPPSELKRYNIRTLTPIPQYKMEKPQQLLEIKDNDKAIAAYLSARSIKTLKGFTKRKMLEEYAKQQNKRIVFINDSTINKSSE